MTKIPEQPKKEENAPAIPKPAGEMTTAEILEVLWQQQINPTMKPEALEVLYGELYSRQPFSLIETQIEKLEQRLEIAESAIKKHEHTSTGKATIPME